MSELLVTHLILSLYIIAFVTMGFGAVFIYVLHESKDFSNIVIFILFLIFLLTGNIVWRAIGLPELG